MQRHEIIKPFSDSRSVRLLQTATRQALSRTTRGFSTEGDTGSRQENASKQKARAPFRFNRNGKGSRWLTHGRCAFTAFALLALGCAAQAEELGNFKWSAVVDTNERVVIRGIQYAPEFAPEPWSISRASDSATDVTRFEVRAGDQWGEDRSSGENKERSELDGYKRRFPQGSDVWGAYAFLIEPGQEYHSDWTAISQMHGSKIRSFHVHYKEGRLIIYSEAAGANGQAASGTRYAGLISRNAWHQVVFHLKGGSGADGRLEFWLDAKKIVDYTGAIGAPGNQAYWKFGIYRGYGPIQTPFAIQFANMEVGVNNLSARITNPLPVK